jgi:geranylgeranyl diphosphate synthase type I
MTLLDYQKKIEKEISIFFKKKIKGTPEAFEKEVLGWLQEYSLRKAKRLRAILVIYGYLLAGGKDQRNILTTSIFIELIHNYLLIHDDIVDKDELRRGKKSLHRLYGLDMAIFAGDVTAALGYEILDSAPFPIKNKLLALAKLNKTIYSTSYGQMSELALRNNIKKGKKATDKEVLAVYQKKTAFYTLVAPLQIGALLAGTNERFLDKIERFALPLGIAFQIRDDLEDGDIEKVFGFNREKYIKIQEQLVISAQKILKQEKAFPQKEKEFLLNLAEQSKIK